jgi:transcription elongation factor Elf1
MLLIWGFKSYLRQLAIVTLVCQSCGNPAAHRVVERTRKFTLFFIPLFPVSHKYILTCTFCGQATVITKDLADQYAVYSASPQPSAPSIESVPPPALGS